MALASCSWCIHFISPFVLAYLAIALGVVAAREMTCWALVGPWGGWAVPAPQDGARGSLGRTQMGQLVAATAGAGRGMDWAREARVAQTTLCSASGSRCPLTLVARRRLARLLLVEDPPARIAGIAGITRLVGLPGQARLVRVLRRGSHAISLFPVAALTVCFAITKSITK